MGTVPAGRGTPGWDTCCSPGTGHRCRHRAPQTACRAHRLPFAAAAAAALPTAAAAAPLVLPTAAAAAVTTPPPLARPRQSGPWRPPGSSPRCRRRRRCRRCRRCFRRTQTRASRGGGGDAAAGATAAVALSAAAVVARPAYPTASPVAAAAAAVPQEGLAKLDEHGRALQRQTLLQGPEVLGVRAARHRQVLVPRAAVQLQLPQKSEERPARPDGEAPRQVQKDREQRGMHGWRPLQRAVGVDGEDGKHRHGQTPHAALISETLDALEPLHGALQQATEP
mmetsp:Transcript_61414/g.192519  ORF Transcript_61414/g.192519 Transcript_61414/m.192519 type:complete len:281 (-) Transcript_61414:736-1578(-)